MNAPPPFTPPQAPPRKKTNTALIVGIVLACILIPCIGLVIVGAMGFNFFKNTIGPMASCAIGFEQVRKAVVDYADDHGGTLPKAESWQDDVRPYYEKVMKSKDEYGPFEPMRADGDWGCKTEAGMTGMAFNSDLSGKKMAEVKDPYGTIVIFEIEKATRNAHGTFKARSKENSPKIMGERRGWIEMPLQGSARGFDMGRRSGKIEIKIDDNSSDEKKKSEDPAPSPEGV